LNDSRIEWLGGSNNSVVHYVKWSITCYTEFFFFLTNSYNSSEIHIMSILVE